MSASAGGSILQRTLMVIGLSVPVAVVVGVVYGLIIDDIPRGLGVGGAAVMVVAAVLAVLVASGVVPLGRPGRPRR